MIHPKDKKLKLLSSEYDHMLSEVMKLDEVGLIGVLEELTKRERAFLAAMKIEDIWMAL